MYTTVILYVYSFTEIDEASKQSVLCNVSEKYLVHMTMYEQPLQATHTYVHL